MVLTYFKDDFSVVGEHPHFAVISKEYDSTKEEEVIDFPKDQPVWVPSTRKVLGSDSDDTVTSISDQESFRSRPSSPSNSDSRRRLRTSSGLLERSAREATNNAPTTSASNGCWSSKRQEDVGPGLSRAASEMSSIALSSTSSLPSLLEQLPGNSLHQSTSFLQVIGQRVQQLLEGRKDPASGLQNAIELGQLPLAYYHQYKEKMNYPGKLKQLFLETSLKEKFQLIKTQNKAPRIYVGLLPNPSQSSVHPEKDACFPPHIISNLRYLMSLQASERRKVDALRLVRTYQRLFEEDLLARHTGSLLELLRCGLPDDFLVSEEDDTTFIEMEEDAWSHVKLIPHFLKSSQTPSEAEANEEVPDSLEPVQRSHTPDIHTAPALQEIHSSSTSPLSSKPPSSLQAPTLSSRAVTTKMSPQAQPFVLPKQVSRLKSGVPIVQYTGGLVWHLTVLDHPSQMATVEHVLVPMALTAGVISFDAEGVRLGSDGQLTLVQFAVRDVQMGGVCVFIVDVLGLRAGGFEGRLGDFFAGALLQDPKVVKLVHDCHSDAAALAAQHGLQIQAVYDTQVACELLTGVVLGSFSELLCRSGASAHATKRENKALMRKDEGCWARRPLPDQMLNMLQTMSGFYWRLEKNSRI